MHTTDSFYHHKIVLLTQDTEGSHDGRHSHGRPYGSCSRKRCYGESKDIGTDFCHRIMAFSHFSQSRSIRLSLGRSRDPCFNRLHDAHIDPPLTQTHDKRSGDECFPDARIGRSDKNPSRAGIVSASFGSSHSLGASGLQKNYCGTSRKTEQPLAGCSKSSDFSPAEPCRAETRLVPNEGLPIPYTSLKGSGRGCPLTARIERPRFHRGGSASKKGTWPLPAQFFSIL